MVSQVTIGDIRGLLMDSDKRPVLRLLPEMNEVCRGYTIAHLGDAGYSLEDIANQVWMLNVTNWIKRQDELSWNLFKDLYFYGFERELHEFALKTAKHYLLYYNKKGERVLKKSVEILKAKRKWLDGKVSTFKFMKMLIAYNNLDYYGDYLGAYYTAASAADGDACKAARQTMYTIASWATEFTTYAEFDATFQTEINKQFHLLADMLEDTVGIERGFNGESLESKVFEGGL